MCAALSAAELDQSITTDRLLLRPPTMDDAWRIADLANDYGVASMTSNIPHPYRYEDASAFLSGPRAKPLSQSRLFAIEHRAFGVIGMIGLTRKDKFATELGYWLGRTFWGRGLATEAADAVTAWAFDVWGRRVILASHFADNPASGRVLIKTGFLYTGEVRPLYSVSRGEAASARMMICLT